MADNSVRLNDLATASDGAYIYAEASDGTQVKISKANLASVVAGLLAINGNNYFKYRGTCSDANGNTMTGLYDYTSNSTAISGANYGILLCFYNSSFPTTWAWGVQLFFGENNSVVYRTSIRKAGVWGNWTTL